MHCELQALRAHAISLWVIQRLLFTRGFFYSARRLRLDHAAARGGGGLVLAAPSSSAACVHGPVSHVGGRFLLSYREGSPGHALQQRWAGAPHSQISTPHTLRRCTASRLL